MSTPNVSLPSLRAFLGAIALERTTSQTANRSLYKLQGGLTTNDTQVRDVVNAAIDALDAVDAGHSAIAIDLTGATPSYSLTAAQVRHSVLQLFGTHGAYLPVILPSDARGVWVVQNGSDESVEVALGGGGVAVPVGEACVAFVNADGEISAISASFDPASPGAIGGTTPAAGTFTGLTVSGLTASRYVVTDGSKALSSQSGVPLADLKNAGGAIGDLGVWNGSAWSRLVAVAQGQVLRSAGSGAAPDYGQIDNTHVSSSAAIAGSKISPSFGAQNITTTGTLSAGSSTLSAVNVTGLTASRYVVTDGSKNLASQQGVPLADLGNSGGAAGDVAIYGGSNWVRSAQSALIYRAVDANHLHVYRCDETSGATVTDTGSGAKDLTLTGTEGTAYVRGSFRGSRFARGVSLYADTTARSAASAATASIAGSPCTIECVYVPGYASGLQMIMSLDAGSSNDYFFIDRDANSYYIGIKIGGVEVNTGASPVSIRHGVRTHLMATYDRTASPTLSFYVDGVLLASSSAMSSVPPTWNRIVLGNLATLGTAAARGTIFDARVSNVARGAAYAITAAEAAYLL